MEYYVRIDGLDDDFLGFLGYTCVAGDTEFKLYRDYRGFEYIVHLECPFLLVDDPNDAEIIASRSSVAVGVSMPPDDG